MSVHDTRLDYRSRIARVLRELQRVAAAGEPTPPADDLARLASFSRAHFMRVFASMVGETVSEHTRRLRLERAAGDLIRTDDQVIRIALRSGYQAHEPFTRAFTDHFGVSPSEFRTSASEPLRFPLPPGGGCSVHYGLDDAVNRFVPVLKENPMMEVKLVQAPARRLFALRHRGPYAQIGATFAKLGAWAGPKGYFRPGAECMGVYHDSPQDVAPEHLRAEACVTAPPGAQPDQAAGISILELPACDCAMGVFKGPYTRLDEAYQWLFGSWLPASGREPADAPAFEIYLNDPSKVPPEECLTAIHIPLKLA